MPAVASAGVAPGLTSTSPAGSAISVSSPLSTTTAPARRAASRAWCRRRARTSSRRRRRAAGRARPRAGVRTVGAGRRGEVLEQARVRVEPVGVEQRAGRAPAPPPRARTPRPPSLRPSPGPRTSAPPRRCASASTRRTPAATWWPSSLGQRQLHDLDELRGGDRLLGLRDARRDVSRSGARRGLAREDRRAEQPARAARDEHVPARELRPAGTAPRERRQQRVVLDQPDVGRIARRAGRNADVDDPHRPGARPCRGSRTGRAWRRGRSRSRRRAPPRRRSRRSRRPRRWARRRRRRARRSAAIAAIASATRPRGSPAKPVPSSASTITAAPSSASGSNRRGGRRRAGARSCSAASPRSAAGSLVVQHAHLAPGLAQQARARVAVAAVVAAAADHDDVALRRDLLDERRKPRRGGLHEVERRDRARSSIAQRSAAREPRRPAAGPPRTGGSRRDRHGARGRRRVRERQQDRRAELVPRGGAPRRRAAPTAGRRRHGPPRSPAGAAPRARAPSSRPPSRRSGRRAAGRAARAPPRSAARRR